MVINLIKTLITPILLFNRVKIIDMTIYHRSPVNVNSKIVKFFNVACQGFLLDTQIEEKL
jgi:hypothetical protein